MQLPDGFISLFFFYDSNVELGRAPVGQKKEVF